MMSVPAINSLPSSGSQPSKMNSNPTANPSVSPIGLSVPPKLSVIPSSQISTSQSKPPIGINHSSVPLSLVYENKVISSQAQQSLNKSPSDKPKDLSPAKPTSNGVEASATKLSSPSQQIQPSSNVPNNKIADASVQQNINHSDDRIPPASNELSTAKEETVQTSVSQSPNVTAEKIEQSLNQNISKKEENPELKLQSVAQPLPSPLPSLAFKEESTSETKPEKEEAKTSPTQAGKRKREQKSMEKKDDEPEPEPEKKPRRIRSQVLPYQSPLPELATFINKSLKEKDALQKNNEERLIVFYRNEFLAVRNAEGGFYLCQTLQNVYRSSHRIRIRWLSQKKEKSNDDGDIYTPDFYDLTDFECILTTVALNKLDKNMYKLPKVELERIESILKRALDVEKGVTEKPSITEEHPDGIDLSLYKDESQLQKPKKGSKRTSRSPSRRSPKQAKKNELSEVEKTPKKTKGKSRSKTASKKATKTVSEKNKTRKRNGGRSESKLSKAVDQLKVSPPNEKARVVAKVLRKVDIVPAKEVSTKKQAKLKATKRPQETLKNQKKKPSRSAAKKSNSKDAGKEESSLSSHHERRQGKNKHSSNKN